MVVGSPTKLNLIPSGVMPVVYINQGDAGYDKEFLVYNGDSPYNVPAGVSATIRGKKADGYGVTEAAALTEGSNLATVTITEQMVAAEGANLYELVFVDTDGLRIATINMVWAVKQDALDDAVISDSDLDYATQVMDQLQSVQAFKNQMDTNTANIEANADGLAAETAARIASDNALQVNISEEASARAAQDAVLSARMDTFSSLPSGSTSGNAELLDIRVGADGMTYPSAGDAVRGQFKDLTSELDLLSKITEPGKNLFNGIVTVGYIVNPDNGNLTAFGTHSVSKYIPIEAGKTYTISNNSGNTGSLRVAFYTSAYGYISGIAVGTDDTFTAPNTAAYLRFSMLTTQMVNVQLELGSAATTYEAYYLIVKPSAVSYIQSQLTRLTDMFVPDKNLFDGSVTSGYIVNPDTGDLTAFATHSVTDFITIDASTTYTISNRSGNLGSLRVAFYDSSKTYISGIAVGTYNTFQTPVTAAFLRFSMLTSYMVDVQMEVGPYATEYEPYKLVLDPDRVNAYTRNETNKIVRNASAILGAQSRIATISFIFDDGAGKDAEIVDIFNPYGIPVGFALLSTINQTRIGEYLSYQENGNEILSHSTDSTTMSDTSMSVADAETRFKNSKKVLTGYGFDVRGWVTPGSTLNEIYIPTLEKYYDFGFTVYGGEYSDPLTDPSDSFSTSVWGLKRTSVQLTTLANMKAAVDATIASGGFLVFYGHAVKLDDGTDYETTANLTALAAYIQSKVADLQCVALKPSDAIDYYYHIRQQDLT